MRSSERARAITMESSSVARLLLLGFSPEALRISIPCCVKWIVLTPNSSKVSFGYCPTTVEVF